MIRKCLEHCDKKYTVINNIWKVFAILLEYCCTTDYRMLISEINKENKVLLDKLDSDYQYKFNDQAKNEAILKANSELV